MVDVGLLPSKLQTRLHEAGHSEEALFVWVYTLFELDDVLFGWEKSGGTDQLGWVGSGVPIYVVRMVLPLLLFLSS